MILVHDLIECPEKPPLGVQTHLPAPHWANTPATRWCALEKPSALRLRTTGAVLPQKQQSNAPPVKKQDWCGSTGSEAVPDGNWGEACKAHDECYGTPGAIKEVCDVKLTLDMTATCSGKIFVPALCLMPGTFYGGVLIILGWTPFWHPSRDAYDAAQGR